MDVISTRAETVSEYASKLARAVRAVGPGLVEGEVQRPKTSTGGMLWFTLTDGEAVLSCKVFRGQVGDLEHVPREGDLVKVEVERPDLWLKAGKLDLIVRQVRLAGEGELLRRREALIARLTADGLCDPARRKPLPPFPRIVGLVAGEGSDGLSDAIRALVDRWPAVHILVCTSAVQGAGAPRQLIDALASLQQHPLVDVIVVARGGGSVQDLMCFDDEGLCRALSACAVPVVCAVGHTDNNPVCNYVTWPAFTPSRSAELVVPSAKDIQRDLATSRERLDETPRVLARLTEGLQATASQAGPTAFLESRMHLLKEHAAAIRQVVSEQLGARRAGLDRSHGVLASAPHRAARELSGRREMITSVVAVIAQGERALDSLDTKVRDLAVQIRRGSIRQCDDHTRDFGRALTRLGSERRTAVDRAVTVARDLLGREAEVLGDHSRRRLVDAQRAAQHAAALVRAHDFRRRGWLLAVADGAAVRSAADLKPGSGIDLQLHDGRANAVVSDVNLNSEGRTP